MNEPWWRQPLRVIQTNLQVADTPRMNAEKIAREIDEMGGNALVVNVGGIYGWYPSEVPFHHVNEYLPEGRDLLAELIDACHRRDIRLIGRYDFSKAYDHAYQLRPQWFHRDANGQPHTTGSMRPGKWDLLYTTCINSAYRNEAVAVPVLRESLARYDMDGVFFNAPHPSRCHCGHCKAKYLAYYGQPLPDDESLWHPDWMSRILRDSMEGWNAAVKETRPGLPLILYYSIASDNLYDRIATCDMICCEPQDNLSLGWRHIPQNWKPALCIRLGRSEPSLPQPFGIVHSCPGMDWRHTGLPPAEYKYWLSQIPANGGQIWHSITGFPDTISDKRILHEVSDINHRIMKVEGWMHGARSNAQIALYWNLEGEPGRAFTDPAGKPANGWAEAMLDAQFPYDVLLREQIEAGRLEGYRVLVLPRGTRLEGAMLEAVEGFVRDGGRVLVESVAPDMGPRALALLGIEDDVVDSEQLVASYLRLEAPAGGNPLAVGFERTPLLPHRGVVQYVQPQPGVRVLATLVPPFAPLEAVGAPPERASIPNPVSDLPLCLYTPHGEGGVLLMTFEMAWLVTELKLGEHTDLVRNALDMLLEGKKALSVSHVRGLQAMDYLCAGGERLVHLVNGIGQRPLDTTIVLSDVTVSLPWAKEKPPAVQRLLDEGPVAVALDGGVATITVDRLDAWEALLIREA